MPLISVIIPIYNSENTIRETIESVLEQTFSDFEIIAIDDGSIDSTLQILKNIKDQRLKIFSYPNAGSNPSRNRGISLASGEFIAFLDADDFWTPDKLESQLKALEANPQAIVAYSWTNCIDRAGDFLRRGSHVSFSGNVYAQLLLTDFLDNGSNPLIRTSALKEAGGFDEILTHAEDWDMWLRLAAKYQFVAVPSVQIFYRVSDDSASANIWKMEENCLRVIERAFSQAPASLQHLKKHSITNIYKYLTFRSIETYPKRNRASAAARFLWFIIRNDPAMLRAGVTLKILFKIIVVLLLPAGQAEALINKFKRLFNTNTILGYLRTDL